MRTSLLLAVLALLATAEPAGVQTGVQTSPNIVLIYADDLA